MTRDEALAILDLEREEAVAIILALAEKAEKYDRLCNKLSPTTPSGMTPVYLKPAHRKRRKPPGRSKGHPGVARLRPTRIGNYQEHTLDCCPDCQTPLGEPLDTYRRYIEDLPPIQPTVTEALPNAMIGLRLVLLTAWLHYLVGVSVNNLVKMV